MQGIRELGSTDWFNARLTPKATRNLYFTYVRSRIIYGVIVCTACETTCQEDELLQVQFFKALLKLKRATSGRQTERLSIMYRIQSIRDEICKQSSMFVQRLKRTKDKGSSDKLKRHALRSLRALEEIGDKIVCGRERLSRNEPWGYRLEKRYDERRAEEGSNNPTTRKPNRVAKWKDEERLLVDTRMNAKRRSAVARWFIHRFPISLTESPNRDNKLRELRRWSIIVLAEKAEVIAHLDKII